MSGYVLRPSAIYAGIEDDIMMVGFADREPDTEEYVILQRGTRGTESLYIEVQDQVRSRYGGVEHIRVSSDAVHIELSPEAMKDLRVGGHIFVQGIGTHPSFGAAVDLLRRIAHEGGIPFEQQT